MSFIYVNRLLCASAHMSVCVSKFVGVRQNRMKGLTEDKHTAQNRNRDKTKQSGAITWLCFALHCLLRFVLFYFSWKDPAPPFMLVCWLVCLLVLCVCVYLRKYWYVSLFFSFFPFSSSLLFSFFRQISNLMHSYFIYWPLISFFVSVILVPSFLVFWLWFLLHWK